MVRTDPHGGGVWISFNSKISQSDRIAGNACFYKGFEGFPLIVRFPVNGKCGFACFYNGFSQMSLYQWILLPLPGGDLGICLFPNGFCQMSLYQTSDSHCRTWWGSLILLVFPRVLVKCLFPSHGVACFPNGFGQMSLYSSSNRLRAVYSS